MNFEKARNTMVENQLRPNKITNQEILKSFLEIKKEMFLRSDLQSTAYGDFDINLTGDRGYLKNLHIAQLIQYSNINKKDKVLHIGALTGYVSSILSMLSNQVIAIENNENLFQELNNNINKLQFKNIEVYSNDLRKGFKDKLPYSLIFIDNPLTSLPKDIYEQLNPSFGRIMMIKKIRDNLGKGICINRNNKNFNEEILFDAFSKLQLYENTEEFVF